VKGVVMSFATRLQKLMKERSLSIGDVSRATGAAKATVKWWVDGKTLQLKYDDAVGLAKVFRS